MCYYVRIFAPSTRCSGASAASAAGRHHGSRCHSNNVAQKYNKMKRSVQNKQALLLLLQLSYAMVLRVECDAFRCSYARRTYIYRPSFGMRLLALRSLLSDRVRTNEHESVHRYWMKVDDGEWCGAHKRRGGGWGGRVEFTVKTLNH